MSNVRSLYTEVHARQSVIHLEQRAGLEHRYQRQQEAVQESEDAGAEQSCKHTNRFLGRPSVGGRLTAGAARSEHRSPHWRSRGLRGGSAIQNLPGTASLASSKRREAQQLLAHVLVCRCKPRQVRFVPHAALRCTAAPRPAGRAGAGEYARATWRPSASAARMRHALAAGI